MEFNGLPLHPLVIHAAVIFGPLAGLVALTYLVPRWRDRMRWPMVIGAIIALGAVFIAYLSGNDFRDSKPFFDQAPLADKIDTHEDLAGNLLLGTIAFAAIAVLSAWLHARTGALRIGLNLLLAASAIGVIVLVILTGDAGAQAVWGT
jgi:uncharacterized membrane protein